MSAIKTNRTFRRRNAALVAAAAAIAAGAFGQVAPANASPLTVDGYVAIAVQIFDSSSVGVGLSVSRDNEAKGEAEAASAALSNCAAHGCAVIVRTSRCGAVSMDEPGLHHTGTGSTRQQAEANVLSYSAPGARILVSACAPFAG